MPSNIVQDGKFLTLVAPAAKSSGDGVKVGSIFGVAQADAESGADVVVDVEYGKVYTLPKVAGVAAFAQGAKCYWNDGTGKVTAVATDDFIGHCTEAALIGDDEITLRIRGEVGEAVDADAVAAAGLGTLAGLTTTDKASAVAAINEVDANADAAQAAIDAHEDGAASKHDGTEIDYERADGSKKNVQAASDTVEAALTDLDDATGALSGLTTTDKTSVVAAINEVDANADAAQADATQALADAAAAQADATQALADAAAAVADGDLLHESIAWGGGGAQYTAAKPASFVNDKPVMATIQASTSGVALYKAICTAGNLTIDFSANPGAGTIIGVWQDVR